MSVNYKADFITSTECVKYNNIPLFQEYTICDIISDMDAYHIHTVLPTAQ